MSCFPSDLKPDRAPSGPDEPAPLLAGNHQDADPGSDLLLEHAIAGMFDSFMIKQIGTSDVRRDYSVFLDRLFPVICAGCLKIKHHLA